MWWPWTPAARRRARCFHHDLPERWEQPQSYIRSRLIETGARKMLWCDEKLGGCGRTWFI